MSRNLSVSDDFLPNFLPYFLIDTHCHINMMIKKNFDTPLNAQELKAAAPILQAALENNTKLIINVGTSLVESLNCILLAQEYAPLFAAIGIHPNDCTATWQHDLKELIRLCRDKDTKKIVAIGECGLDFHYPDYNVQRQKDAFKAQIELALEHDLAIIVHTRDAGDETLQVLEEYKKNGMRGVIHCFSEDQSFAHTAIDYGFVIGIGGTITYPKNNSLRSIVQTIDPTHFILETDAPFLPPQTMRGQQNNPANIAIIVAYIAELRGETIEEVAKATTATALKIFRFKSY